MKLKIVFFFLIYILIPLIIIPYFCARTGAWYGLFGILFYYAGLFIARFDQWVFFPVPLFFCFWYWYTYGFSLRDYVFIFFLCLIAGVAVWKISDLYERLVHGILPESEQNDEYTEKLHKMEQMIENYRQQHPGEQVTQEIVDRIKAQVFFK